jgi:hypothetical protein
VFLHFSTEVTIRNWNIGAEVNTTFNLDVASTQHSAVPSSVIFIFVFFTFLFFFSGAAARVALWPLL